MVTNVVTGGMPSVPGEVGLVREVVGAGRAKCAGRDTRPFIFCCILTTLSAETTRAGGKSASLSVSKSSGQGPWQVSSHL